MRQRHVIGSPGGRLRQLLGSAIPLQIFEVINADHAQLAHRASHRAIYLSVANLASGFSWGAVPRLGHEDELLSQVRQVTEACTLPLVVDLATGFGARAAQVQRTVRGLIQAGAAACHIEDPVWEGRLGHRPDSQLDCIKAAADVRHDAQFCLIARTELRGGDGFDAALERASQCLQAGADAIFIDSFSDRATYERFVNAIKAPVLADIRELAQVQLATPDDLAQAGVPMALYRWSTPAELAPPARAHRAGVVNFRSSQASAPRVVHEMMN